MVAYYQKAFLTDEAWQILSQSTPASYTHLSDDSAIKTFEEAFTNTYFHYSHFRKGNGSAQCRITMCRWFVFGELQLLVSLPRTQWPHGAHLFFWTWLRCLFACPEQGNREITIPLSPICQSNHFFQGQISYHILLLSIAMPWHRTKL